MKILIFSSREICYFSSNFFANQIGEAFVELGNEVEICELSKEDDLDEMLGKYVEQSYDLILDFNSLLPRMALDDGSLLVNHIHGPFYNWIVDHPLFHHPALEKQIVDSRAIFLDTTQQEYVKQYYPQVKKTIFLPLTGKKSFLDGKKEKEPCIFFPATYGCPIETRKIMQRVVPRLHDAMNDMIEHRIEEPELSMEEAYRIFLRERGEEKDSVAFREDMNAMYPADMYVRNYFRKKNLDALLQAGIPVKVMGHNWENYPHSEHCNLQIEKPVFFNLSYDKIAKEHILLDISPMFHHGIHDRVFGGMANWTVVLTEANPCKKKYFTHGKEMFFYSLKKEKELVYLAEELLTNSGLREQIQEHAYDSFCKNHTWKNRAESLLKTL